MSLVADIVAGRGAFSLEAEFRAEPGTVLGVVGPNGAGKTTLLHCLAGLEPIEDGRIELDGVVLDEPATDTFVMPRRRGVGFVFQEGRLFPNLDLTDNVAFGLRARRRANDREAAREWLDRMGLGDRSHDRPAQLSGGERGRVALARALASEPKLLVLDEPFAALDVTRRSTTRALLASVLGDYNGVTVLVSHSPVDALSLSDEVAVIEGGRITQRGTPQDLRSGPRSRWAADFAGVNMLVGVAHGYRVSTDRGATVFVADPVTGAVTLVFHPHAVALHSTQPTGSPRNAWAVRVESIDDEGPRRRVVLDGEIALVAEITASAADELAVEPGRRLWASVKATEIDVEASPTALPHPTDG